MTANDLDVELDSVKSLIGTTVTTLAPDGADAGWPYDLEDGKDRPRPSESTSTMLMIGYTLAVLIVGDGVDDSATRPLTLSDLDDTSGSAASLERGLQLAVGAVNRLAAEEPPVEGGSGKLADVLGRIEELQTQVAGERDTSSRRVKRFLNAAIEEIRYPINTLTDSSLFGEDDPFTLDWILRISALTSAEETAKATLESRVRAIASKKADALKKRGPKSFKLGPPEQDALNYPTESAVDPAGKESQGLEIREGRRNSGDTYVSNTWPLVRFAYLAQLFPEPLESGLDDVLEDYFEAEIAQQLGYADIADSAFDVATLVFALDGLTLLKPEAHLGGLLERVVHVVRRSQELDPRLQPRRPFKLTATGGVHIAVGTEVFLALARVVRRVKPHDDQARLFQQLFPIFSRFTQYLTASVTKVRLASGSDFWGWSSDHEYSASRRVETWYTSQVILYLAEYGALVRDYSAELHLRSVGLRHSKPPTRRANFFGATDALTSFANSFSTDASSQPRNNSFLLYGPPGTGKTTMAEQLASSLGWNYLAISPSHFVAEGSDRVEERASRLFTALSHQIRTVVFFDEIDRLILDRSSKAYGLQGDMFQFMTPSMLSKLNDLRRGGKVVFGIGTNYAWRIDGAILRPGRIDQHVLVLPPGLHERQQIIEAANLALPPSFQKSLAAKTTLASITELQRLLSISSHDAKCDVEGLLADFSPTISLASYRAHVADPPSGKCEDFLVDELSGLASLLAEEGAAEPALDPQKMQVVKWLFDELDRDDARRAPKREVAWAWCKKSLA